MVDSSNAFFECGSLWIPSSFTKKNFINLFLVRDVIIVHKFCNDHVQLQKP